MTQTKNSKTIRFSRIMAGQLQQLQDKNNLMEINNMRPGLNEPVSVLSIYSKQHKIFKPAILSWNGVDYRLGKIDFYHKTKKGATTLHHFSLTDKEETTYFKLLFNATNLNWTLEEYMMAGTNNVSY